MANDIKLDKSTNKDDLDSLLAEFDIDNSEKDEVEHNRSPASRVLHDVKAASKQTFGAEGFVFESIVKKALPTKIVDDIDKTVTIKDSLADELRLQTSGIRKELKPIMRAFDRMLPSGSKYKDKLSQFNKKVLGDDGEYAAQEQKVDPKQTAREKAGKTFTTGPDGGDVISDLINKSLRHKKDATAQHIQHQSLVQLTQLNQYTLKVTSAYQRKSLELKYRSLFILKEQLARFGEYSGSVKAQLEAVIKNTGLPEEAKLQHNERLFGVFKESMATRIVDTVQGDSTIVENIVRNATDKVKDLFSRGRDALAMVGDMTEAAADSAEAKREAKEMGQKDPSFAAVQGISGILGFITSRVRDRIDNTLNKRGLLDKINFAKGNIPDMLEEAAILTGDEGFVKKQAKKAAGFLSGLTRASSKAEQKVGGILDMSPEKLKKLDARSKISLVEVIPGYLAKILRQVTVLSTDEDPGDLSFDFTKRKFSTKGDIKASIVKSFSRSGERGVGRELDSIITSIEKGGVDLSDDNKEMLKFLLMRQATEGKAKGFNLFDKSGFYDGLDDKDKDNISNILDQHIIGSDSPVKAKTEFNKLLANIRINVPEPASYISDLIEMGYSNILEELNVISVGVGGDVKINNDTFMKLLIDMDAGKDPLNINTTTVLPVSGEFKSDLDEIKKTAGGTFKDFKGNIKDTVGRAKQSAKDTVDTVKGKYRETTDNLKATTSKRNIFNTIAKTMGKVMPTSSGGKFSKLVNKSTNILSSITTKATAALKSAKGEVDFSVLTSINTASANTHLQGIKNAINELSSKFKKDKPLHFEDELAKLKRRKKGKDEGTDAKGPLTKGKDFFKDMLLPGLATLLGGAASSTLGLATTAATAGAGLFGLKKLKDTVFGSKEERAQKKEAKKKVKVPTKAGSGVVAKITAKSLAKSAAKKIPLAAAGVGTALAADRLLDGQFGKGALEFLSGLAGATGVGIPLSLAIDGYLLKSDIADANKNAGEGRVLVVKQITSQLEAIKKNPPATPLILIRLLNSAAVSLLTTIPEPKDAIAELLSLTAKALRIKKDNIINVVRYSVNVGTLANTKLNTLAIPVAVVIEATNILETLTDGSSVFAGGASIANRANIKPNAIKPIVDNVFKLPVANKHNNSVMLPRSKSNVTHSGGNTQGTSVLRPTTAPTFSGKIPMLVSPLYPPDGGEYAIKKFKSSVNIRDIHPDMRDLFFGMANEYFELTGKKIQVNSGFRSTADQAKLKQSKGDMAAMPGRSLHEFGLALDINTSDANALDKLGLLRKYGFTRPLQGETWHIEPALIQFDIAKAKADSNFSSQLIRDSVGLGGGGLATVTPKGKKPVIRNLNLARSLLGKSATKPISPDAIGKVNISAGKYNVNDGDTGIGGYISGNMGNNIVSFNPNFNKSELKTTDAPIIKRTSVSNRPTVTSAFSGTISNTDTILNSMLPTMDNNLTTISCTLTNSLKVQIEILNALLDKKINDDAVKAATANITPPPRNRTIPEPTISLAR